MKNTKCRNCGKKNHTYRFCSKPILSIGIICFKDDKLLMVQRQHTMGFVDLIRGEYTEETREILVPLYISEMIPEEIELLKFFSFNFLWNYIWLCSNYYYCKPSVREKFESLNINQLVSDYKPRWTFQEFGFPKGHKHFGESHLHCAIREFEEETGFTHIDYTIFNKRFEEEFIGTNGVHYKHIYYLAKLHDIPVPQINSLSQMTEIKTIGFFTHKECLSIVRDYDMAKKKLINNVFHYLKKNNC